MGLKEIARMTGLSITTVSHALNGTRAVSQKSMALIRDAVAKTGYRPNGAAQALKTQRTNMIALPARPGLRPFRPALSESFCQARFRRNREIFRWKQSDP